ncbi:Exocyst complex component 3-like protein 2 [Collichthys lucidus]|uniref:Exocyst complex component 3-like protein 2 n=1 Tax=Collichthys lucidus TaxID=240159 RepID=A0A4U5VA97_COLLU|nr:Exocyst complex component 3-like protein 2 [Collichthys lucidus]
MPILKKLPGRSKSCHEFPRVNGELILPRLDLDLRDLNDLNDLKLNDLSDLNKNLNPFEDVDLDDDERNGGDMGLIMGGGVRGNLQLRSTRDGEEEENEVNAERHGAGNPKGRPLKGTLERICGVSPLKTLGKLGKGLRISGRNVWGNNSPNYSPGDSNTLPPEREKRKGIRRGSEGIMTLLRFTGRRKEERRESLPCGNLFTETEAEASRRSSFLRMVSLGKLKRESMSDKASQEAEEETDEEEPVVKTREPLSVLEILQLVNHRDLLLADTHIQELERECELLSHLPTPPNLTPNLCPSTPPGMIPLSSSSLNDESLSSNATLDSSRRKAKDVELLYEALQREMWDVVRESLRQPSAGPNLGLVVLVIQQEEHADAAWALREEIKPERESPQIHVHPSQRPRRLKAKWRQAVAEAADWSLPHQVDTQAGQLASYLERLRSRMVDDLDAARRNAVSIYPEEFTAFQVYVESYHRAVAKRLRTITSGPLQITDVYSLLDWFYNIYNRDVLGTIGTTTPISYTPLEPILAQNTVDRLEQDCISIVREKVTTELVQILDEEERRWAQSLHIEEYQSHLARSVIQRVKVDLDRSTSVNQFLGARVARCSLIGLADFLYNFQRKVEMFHETQAEFGDRGDGYVSRTIALVNCCPPLRSLVERCRQCDPQSSEESAQRANSSLDRIINQSVRVLTDRLFEHIRPFFDKLIKRKWLNNTEAFEAIEACIKQHFKKFRRMDSPPYQTLVGEVHRRVLVEYVRSIMRGRVICTSSKMRKRMAFRLQDEAKQLKGLFKDLESSSSWLDSVICHLADIILLEDTPSIQMEVAVLVKEFPDIRKKHVSTLLNVRGMMRQAERQEILNIVKDFECSNALMCRDHALFSDIPITSEVHCISLGFLRLAMTVTNWFSEHRPRRNHRASARNASSQPAEGQNVEDVNKHHRED